MCKAVQACHLITARRSTHGTRACSAVSLELGSGGRPIEGLLWQAFTWFPFALFAKKYMRFSALESWCLQEICTNLVLGLFPQKRRFQWGPGPNRELQSYTWVTGLSWAAGDQYVGRQGIIYSGAEPYSCLSCGLLAVLLVLPSQQFQAFSSLPFDPSTAEVWNRDSSFAGSCQGFGWLLHTQCHQKQGTAHISVKTEIPGSDLKFGIMCFSVCLFVLGGHPYLGNIYIYTFFQFGIFLFWYYFSCSSFAGSAGRLLSSSSEVGCGCSTSLCLYMWQWQLLIKSQGRLFLRQCLHKRTAG